MSPPETSTEHLQMALTAACADHETLSHLETAEVQLLLQILIKNQFVPTREKTQIALSKSIDEIVDRLFEQEDNESCD